MQSIVNALAIIGLIFVVMSLFAARPLIKDKGEGKEIFWQACRALWILIGFGIGSWLISLTYWHILKRLF